MSFSIKTLCSAQVLHEEESTLTVKIKYRDKIVQILNTDKHFGELKLTLAEK